MHQTYREFPTTNVHFFLHYSVIESQTYLHTNRNCFFLCPVYDGLKYTTEHSYEDMHTNIFLLYTGLFISTSGISDPCGTDPGKTRYPLYNKISKPQSRYGRVRKISPPPGFDPQTVQPVKSDYTDYDIPSHCQI
jgi:hypothetical protein